MNLIERIVVHHSASGRSTTFAQIRRWHTAPKPQGNGWNEIGYNYVILSNGRLRVGRPLPQTGAHARGVNSTSIGICVVGNNLKAGQEWTEAQWKTVRQVVSACSLLWPRIKVCGHRDVMAPGYTECPGIDIGTLLPD